jgi:hypothetical protein
MKPAGLTKPVVEYVDAASAGLTKNNPGTPNAAADAKMSEKMP